LFYYVPKYLYHDDSIFIKNNIDRDYEQKEKKRNLTFCPLSVLASKIYLITEKSIKAYSIKDNLIQQKRKCLENSGIKSRGLSLPFWYLCIENECYICADFNNDNNNNEIKKKNQKTIKKLLTTTLKIN
jgi:hypothetical protein